MLHIRYFGLKQFPFPLAETRSGEYMFVSMMVAIIKK